MAILAKECIDWISGTLGDTPSDAGIQILNAAGEMLVDMHQWRWLEREGTIKLTADQNYATLPTGFKALLKANEDGSYSAVRTGTIELMVQLKSSAYSGQNYFTGVITYQKISDVPTPVMRLDPTPSADEDDAINVAYLIGWEELSSDNSSVIIPPWCMNLYRQLVVAYARGWDEDDETRSLPPGQLIEEHLLTIRSGMTFKAAVNRDEQINPSMGRIRKGWLLANGTVYNGVSEYGYLRSLISAPGTL